MISKANNETKTKIQMNNLYSAVEWQSFFDFSIPTFAKWGRGVRNHIIPHEQNNYHPHILSHRLLALFSVLAVTIKIASISFVALGPVTTAEASVISSETVLSLTNSARTENSLSELKMSGLLSKAAQNKADDMLAKQYFSHNTPEGNTPWTFIKTVGYSYTTAGENLAIDFSDAESVQTAWMNSPGHRANILNKNFKEIGIGIAKGMFDNHQTTIVVQMFGTPIAQQLDLKSEVTHVEEAKPVQNVEADQPSAVAVSEKSKTVYTAPLVPNTVSQPVADRSQDLKIVETKTSLQGDNFNIEVDTLGNIAKLMVFYGNKSVILQPISNNLWQGQIKMANIGPFDNMYVQASDINGNMHQEPIAQFSSHLTGVKPGEVEGATVTVLGNHINVGFLEERAFMIMLAGLLVALILAIAIKRHIQHLSLIANTSFVAILIAMLMMV